jgi:hypothetical protein
LLFNYGLKKKFKIEKETKELVSGTTLLDRDDPSAVNESALTAVDLFESSSWFYSFIQSIANNMPNLPSDHIKEIVDVDFSSELAVSTFYQLLSQMTLLGSTIFHKCTIVRLLSFTDWNRKYSFADNKPILLSNSEQLDRKEVEPSEAFDELLREQFDEDIEQKICDGSFYSSTTSFYCSSTSSSSASLGQSSQQQKRSTALEIVLQLQYLSPQSELFSKIFHYFTTTIFLRPISYGKCVTRITIPIPSISTIEPILTWLYDHDDKAWIDTITSKNFEQVIDLCMKKYIFFFI